MKNAPVPPLDEARLSRQLDGALARAEKIRVRRRVVRGAAIVALAGALGLLLFFVRPRPPTGLALEGTVIETEGAQTLTLADGTRIEIGARTHADFRAARPDLVRIVLDRGEMELDVAHTDGRSFEVVCAQRTIKVVGTRFHVLADGPRFSVAVSRGRVRVEGPEGAIELGPDETFSRGFEAVVVDAAPEPPPPVVTTTSVPAATVPAPRAETASELFSRAQSARLAGRPAEAARAFDDLRARHRSDARAGLAAFELGRIRLDDLGDPAGAAEAFRDAVALSPSASYREDAEARRVEALDALHDQPRCISARDAYLARYPAGVFRASVSRRCSAP